MTFIALESELDALINACGKITGAFLQGLKDTGADPGELAAIEWTEINFETKTVFINHPVKGHNPRILTISPEFIRRLATHSRKRQRVFNRVSLNGNFYAQRKRVARKLGNPRLEKICFTTFRHWKATMEYHRTHDILHVKRLLGHKNIQNIMIYINLESAIFTSKHDEFHSKVAESTEEACKLTEAGFEYVGKVHGAELFRKRK